MEEADGLTRALDGYLATIYGLWLERGEARPCEIAKARGVKMSSVTIALRRLRELGHITYTARETLSLTPQGEARARRSGSRHELLRRFFREFLDVPPRQAEQDARQMEHQISDLSMERLARFFEFVARCPDAPGLLLQRFHSCQAVNPDDPARAAHGPFCCGTPACHERRRKPKHTLLDLKEGQSGRVLQVLATGAARQALLDMGFLPGKVLHLLRIEEANGSRVLRLDEAELVLSAEEAAGIKLEV